MKKITSYLVAVFALATMLMVSNIKAAHAEKSMIDHLTARIISAEPNSDTPGLYDVKVQIVKIVNGQVVDTGETKVLSICNQDCYNALLAAAGGDPFKVSACPICAKCCDNCVQSLNAHVGTVAKFTVCRDKASKRLYIQATQCCDNMDNYTDVSCSDGTDGICYECTGTIYGLPEGTMVKCYSLDLGL